MLAFRMVWLFGKDHASAMREAGHQSSARDLAIAADLKMSPSEGVAILLHAVYENLFRVGSQPAAPS
jgi:hypothetical protein